MSCEETRNQLAHLEFKLPDQSFDRMVVRNMAQKLEIECIRLLSSYTATVGRVMANAGLDNDKVEDIQKEIHGRFVKTAEELLEKYQPNQPEFN